MTEERLQKVLAHAGLGSRRAVEELIAQGRVTVNGQRARLGRRVDPSKDQVEVDGSPVPVQPGLVYFLANKPLGMVTSSSDPEGRSTVLELVDADVRVWPVGRLDIDTEGALILTNDGDLTHRLTHPRYGVAKTYLAEVSGAVGRPAVRALRSGVDLDDGPARAAHAAIVDRVPGGTLLELTISQGRKRQVRRMLAAIGHPVRRLVRTRIGPLMLGRLRPGTARRLTAAEVGELYRAAADPIPPSK